MRPTILYVLLVISIIADFIGFVLFIIDLIPGLDFISISVSFLLDFIMIAIVIILKIIHKTNFESYKISINNQMTDLQKSLPRSKRMYAKGLNEGISRLNNVFTGILDNISHEAIYLIIAISVEAIPLLGDVSPTWTIKALKELADFKKSIKEVKKRSDEVESLVKDISKK